MITKLTGVLNAVFDDEARVQVGALEYQVLLPEFVRRDLQIRLHEEVTLSISQYFEGNQMSNRLIPRMIGFTNVAELEFFDLFCTVEKIGVRKALKALARPIREIADAIQRQDTKWLTTLPGVGPASAEQIVATLRRKITKFALMPSGGSAAATNANVPADVADEAYRALMSVGHSPGDARDRLDAVLVGGRSYKSVEEVLLAIYAKP